MFADRCEVHVVGHDAGRAERLVEFVQETGPVGARQVVGADAAGGPVRNARDGDHDDGGVGEVEPRLACRLLGQAGGRGRQRAG